MQELQITIATFDEFNRNFNAVVDHECRDLKKKNKICLQKVILFHGLQLTEETVWLKSVIKRKGKLTECKIHTAMRSSTGDITLDDT